MKLSRYIHLAIRHRDDPLFRHYLHGRRVLDIGCGAGEFLARDSVNFVGIDIDERLVAVCREKGLDAAVGSALAPAFPDESFDAVHAAQLVEHLTPAEATLFLSHAARVLKPGGLVFLTTPGVRNIWNTFSHIRPYPPASFRKLLTSKTEAYLSGEAIPLHVEAAYGTRFYFRNRLLIFLSRVLDLLLPPTNPIGWTIILRKTNPAA